MPLLEELLVVAPRALRETRQVHYLGLKAHRDVLPDEKFTVGGTVQVASAKGLNPTQRLHSLVQCDEQGSPVKRSRQIQESRRAPTGKQLPRGCTVKEVSRGEREDVQRGETPFF